MEIFSVTPGLNENRHSAQSPIFDTELDDRSRLVEPYLRVQEGYFRYGAAAIAVGTAGVVPWFQLQGHLDVEDLSLVSFGLGESPDFTLAPSVLSDTTATSMPWTDQVWDKLKAVPGMVKSAATTVVDKVKEIEAPSFLSDLSMPSIPDMPEFPSFSWPEIDMPVTAEIYHKKLTDMITYLITPPDRGDGLGLYYDRERFSGLNAVVEAVFSAPDEQLPDSSILPVFEPSCRLYQRVKSGVRIHAMSRLIQKWRDTPDILKTKELNDARTELAMNMTLALRYYIKNSNPIDSIHLVKAFRFEKLENRATEQIERIGAPLLHSLQTIENLMQVHGINLSFFNWVLQCTRLDKETSALLQLALSVFPQFNVIGAKPAEQLVTAEVLPWIVGPVHNLLSRKMIPLRSPTFLRAKIPVLLFDLQQSIQSSIRLSITRIITTLQSLLGRFEQKSAIEHEPAARYQHLVTFWQLSETYGWNTKLPDGKPTSDAAKQETTEQIAKSSKGPHAGTNNKEGRVVASDRKSRQPAPRPKVVNSKVNRSGGRSKYQKA